MTGSVAVPSHTPAGRAPHLEIGLQVILHAVLFALSFPPFGVWPLAFVCLVPLARAIRNASPRIAYAAGFCGYLLAGALAVEWLSLFGTEAWLGTAFGFALYGLVFTAAVRAGCALRVPSMVWLPVSWCALEFLRGTLFFYAFGWVFLAHAVPMLPMIQAADLFGQVFVSCGVALVNGAALELVDLVLDGQQSATREQQRRRVIVSGTVSLLLLLTMNIYGVIRPRTIELHDGPRVLAVQTNIPQELKNDPDRQDTRFQDSVRLTLAAAKKGEVDVIAWPETMLPVEHSPDPKLPFVAVDRSRGLQRQFKLLVDKTGAPFMVGSLHAELRHGTPIEHNSLFYIGREGKVLARYDKVFLAPMSECTPFQDSWPTANRWLRDTFIPPGFVQFERGPGPLLLDVAGHRIAPSICFDIAFPRATLDAVRAGAEGVVNVTNYAWFKDSAELDLGRIHTIFRAIETRRGMMCAVNGGITHFVDARGEATDFVGANGHTKQVEGTLLLPIRTSTANTLYVRIGELFDWTLVLVMLAMIAIARAIGMRPMRTS